MNSEQLKQWIEENLLTPREAMQVTNQSRSAFNQSVANGLLKPYISKDTVRLYLKSDVEEYARNKRIR
ncbi:hypothetical protein [Niallia sp. FSL M8-0099]|uniref:hypothetical protein n=1 Tax=Niallia sp. FSL M8-0099 TaxID=2954519 RepID=UPI0030F9BCC9